MRCANCRRENQSGAAFCASCGKRLQLACPSCSAPLAAGDRFCSACGHALASASERDGVGAAAVDALRRRATVMFCDLSGYTALNEAFDPEEVEPIMSRIKADATSIVEAFGGLVNQFVGDEVMALFGIPVAHGDDAVRAVLAAQRLHRALDPLAADVLARSGMHIALHTAINTGLLLGRRRDDREGRYTITGDAVNTCARLLKLAGPDDIVVGASTRRLLAARFETVALAPARVKGKAHPLTPYRVIRERSSDERARAEQSQRRRFVGRAAELRRLRELVEAVAQREGGRALYVRGEPGIGKSALVSELRHIAREQGFTCCAAQVLDFGVGRGRDAMSALCASLLDIDASQADEQYRRTAIDEAVDAGWLTPAQRAFADDLLALPPRDELSAIYEAMDDAARRLGKQQTLADLVCRRAETERLLLVVEDAHWADAQTVGYLSQLSRLAAEGAAQLLLALTSRSDDEPLARGLELPAETTTTIDLGPLLADEARALCHELQADDAARCIDRAGGHPLFLEQLVLSAELDADGDAQSVPGSIEAIVLARFDKLPKQDRDGLQAAAVLGQRFALDALRWVSGDDAFSCDTLVSRDLVVAEAADYRFSHALLQEAIYGALVLARRRAMHQRAAEWFASRDLALTAEHLERAEDEGAPHAFLQAARERLRQLSYDD
ncbi:MAG: AAA family ATPase, partial [Myxococcales bacterium]|nr:AAA family ATPase [Myxococcales bacterium]